MSKGKVIDLGLRRQKKESKDYKDTPILRLANNITQLLAKEAGMSTAIEQIAALDLTARAIGEALRHAHGEEGAEKIIRAGLRQGQEYQPRWVEHDESPTVYDNEEVPDTQPSPRRPDETTD